MPEAKIIDQVDVIDATAHPLAVPEPTVPGLFSNMRPAEKLIAGKEVATVLKGMLLEGKIVIDKNGKEKRKPLIIRIPQKDYEGNITGYSEHVEVEGWQTAAMLCNCTIIPRPDVKQTETGFEAYAEVVTFDNRVIGGGTGSCGRDEKRWSRAKNFAMKSQAQTRAQGRAGRSVFAWIMVLAGFSPTPAEEMRAAGLAEYPDDDDDKPTKPEPVKPTGSPPPPRKYEWDEARQKLQARIFIKFGDYANADPVKGAESNDKMHGRAPWDQDCPRCGKEHAKWRHYIASETHLVRDERACGLSYFTNAQLETFIGMIDKRIASVLALTAKPQKVSDDDDDPFGPRR